MVIYLAIFPFACAHKHRRCKLVRHTHIDTHTDGEQNVGKQLLKKKKTED